MAVYFPEAYPEGSIMPEWHQHLTIVPWVRGDVEGNCRALGQMASQFQPFTARVVDEAWFGPRRDIPVWLIEPTDILMAIHKAVYHTLDAAVVDGSEMKHMREGYIPHITPKPQQPELYLGDTFAIDSISIVTKHDNIRTIYRNLRLGYDQNAA